MFLLIYSIGNVAFHYLHYPARKANSIATMMSGYVLQKAAYRFQTVLKTMIELIISQIT